MARLHLRRAGSSMEDRQHGVNHTMRILLLLERHEGLKTVGCQSAHLLRREERENAAQPRIHI